MERSPKLSEAVDFGINSTYLHAHMPKINSSSVKICESSQKVLKKFSKSSQKVLKKFSKSSRPKILNCYPRRDIGLEFQLPKIIACSIDEALQVRVSSLIKRTRSERSIILHSSSLEEAISSI
jgi:hypothetical protein